MTAPPSQRVLRGLALAPLVAAVVLGWLGLRVANPWLELLACGCLAPVLVSLGRGPALGRLEVDVLLPHRAAVGEEVQASVRVRNGGDRPSVAVVVSVDPGGYAPLRVCVPALGAGGTAELTLGRVAQTRGVWPQQEVWLSTTAPFGMVERRRRLHVVRPVIVHPQPLPAAALSSRVAAGEHPAGQPSRAGHELHAVREWRAGDSTRHVHWRSTARHGRLVVAEPEQTGSHRLAMVVAGEVVAGEAGAGDAGAGGAGAGAAGWEALLALAAATAADAAREGREVLLITRDGDPGPAGAGSVGAGSVGAGSGGAGSGGVGSGGAGSVVTGDPTVVLDWFAAVGLPGTPSRQDGLDALDWLDVGGDLVLAGTGGPGFEAWCEAMVRSAGGSGPGTGGERRVTVLTAAASQPPRWAMPAREPT